MLLCGGFYLDMEINIFPHSTCVFNENLVLLKQQALTGKVE